MPRDLVGLLRARVETDPDGAAYRFVERVDEPPVPLTNVELDRGARVVAASLQQQHARGDRVLLLLPAGRGFLYGFFGCALAGLVPVPAPPPTRTRAARMLPPILRIAGDCRPAAVITTNALAGAMRDALAGDDPLLRSAWYAIEQAVRGEPSQWTDPHLGPDDLALVQYTSGSTANPRGVAISQANLMANLETIQRGFAVGHGDHGVIWLPPHHDMGLVGGLLGGLASGIDVTCLSPNDFVQAPVRLLRTISEVGGTISGGPDFAYRLCIDRIRDDQLDGIDLGSWRLAFTGAEPVSAATMRAFTARFGPVGFTLAAFYPCYGLAESTLMVTGGDPAADPVVRTFSRAALDEQSRAEPPRSDGDGRELVCCGAPIDPRSTVTIVDPASRAELSNGEIGEVWVRGPSVALGYYERPDETTTTFRATTADGDGPFLRTGDLGFVVAGELYVTGRIKDTIIVNGRTLDAHDIEETVRATVPIERAGLAAALSIVDDTTERFVLVQEAGAASAVRALEVKRLIQAAIADRFGVRPDDVVLVRIGALPRTTSGKLRRAEARSLYAAGALPLLAEPGFVRSNGAD